MVNVTFDEIKSKLPLREQAAFIGYFGGVFTFQYKDILIDLTCNDYIGATMAVQDLLSRKELSYIAVRKIGDKNFNYFSIL